MTSKNITTHPTWTKHKDQIPKHHRYDNLHEKTYLITFSKDNYTIILLYVLYIFNELHYEFMIIILLRLLTLYTYP